MKIGELRHKIIFQRLNIERDAFGAPVIRSYENFCTAFARVIANSGKQIQQGGSVDTYAAYSITTRYIEGVTADMSIYWPAMEKRFEIVSAIPDSELTKLTVKCNEIT